MNKLFLMMCVFPGILLAGEVTFPATVSSEVKTVSSPQNRVAVLELYTSEGCSSCPPADRFMSQLKEEGISDKQLIPMAFHVTYWDYIGWSDRFANKKFDKRQREQAAKKNSSSVYTPQFLLSGADYRHHSNLSNDINKLVKQKASVDLTLSAQIETEGRDKRILQLVVSTKFTEAGLKNADISKVGVYFVVLENNLSSDVNDGENEGETLHHDFVVRQMFGPTFQKKTATQRQIKRGITLQPEWKEKDLSIVILAENTSTGEVLQAVRLERPSSK